MSAVLRYINSRVSVVKLKDMVVHVKHDEEFPLYAGNKARKMFHYLLMPRSASLPIVSYGGNQSNAMLALAQFAHERRVPFHYYAKPLMLRQNGDAVTGCLREALQLGMNFVECRSLQDAESRARSHPGLNLFVPQGVHAPEAEPGLRQLALELQQYVACALPPRQPVLVCLPSGRGTSAYYLAKHLEPHGRYQVAAVAIACTAAELRVQMGLLSGHPHRLPGNLLLWDTAVQGAMAARYRPFLDTYRELLDHSLYVDLVYGAAAWHTLRRRASDFADHAILYVHTGGLHGNESMLRRYLRSGWVTAIDLQTAQRALAEVERRAELNAARVAGLRWSPGEP